MANLSGDGFLVTLHKSRTAYPVLFEEVYFCGCLLNMDHRMRAL
jgi:hypothetical protein